MPGVVGKCQAGGQVSYDCMHGMADGQMCVCGWPDFAFPVCVSLCLAKACTSVPLRLFRSGVPSPARSALPYCKKKAA